MKILIATDGSVFSTAAIEECCELIDLSDQTSIKIVSAYELQVPMAAEPFAISAETYHQLNNLAQRNARATADHAAEIIRSRLPNISPKIEAGDRLGKPAQAIIDEASAWGADLIVVGSHGRGFWGRLALGSVSDAVLHHAPCSVLIVKREQAENKRASEQE